MKHQNISVTGSLNLNGVGVVTTTSLNAFTASSDTKVDALIAKTGSYATTGSNTFTAAQIVQGTLTAQTLVVQTVTSSVLFTTGSNIIGSSLSNVQQITGSVGITGSLSVNGTTTVNSSVTATSIISSGSASDRLIMTRTGVGTYHLSISGDDRFSIYDPSADAERISITSTGNLGIGTTNPATKLEVAGSVRAYVNSATTTELFAENSTVKVRLIAGTASSFISTTTNHPLIFETNNSERMRIKENGNVAIGTTVDIDHKLKVAGIVNSANGASNSVGGGAAFLLDGSATNGSSLTFLQQGVSKFSIWTYTGSAWGERMNVSSTGLVSINGTNNQERFRLNNTDSLSYLAFSEQNITMWRPNDSGAAFVLQTQANSGTWTGGGGGIEFRPLNTLRMTIGPTGNIGAPSGTNIFNASDIRLKQNISTTTYGLDTISLLNPVKFNWVNGFEPSEDGKDMLGFVAQEVQTVIPEAVESFGGDINVNGEVVENPLRVNEKFIIPVLVKAIQELKAENDSLKEILQRNNIV
jgi:hypothetical protein